MKHAALVLLIILAYSTNGLKAQTNITNDYLIISTADVSDATPYTNALDAANWEPYRLQNIRYQLSFSNGFTIELKSAIELLNVGYPLNLNNYQASLPAGYVPPTLKLLTGNAIGMEVHTPTPKSH